ncbi:MAG: lysophospholipid acyltransferase family protein [Acidobacteriota bacterium]
MKATHALEYYALLIFAHAMRLLPRPLALACGGAIGQVGWWLGPRRRLVLSNLAQALPDATDRQRRRIAARAARNFGRTVTEFVRFDGGDRRRVGDLVRFSGVDELAAATRPDLGALVITAHLGAWALYVTGLAAAGIPVALLIGRQHNPKVDAFIHSIPGDAVTFIPKGRSSVRTILKCLQAGTTVVMVADQHAGKPGTRVPFLGRRTSMLALPGAIVAKYGAPVFLMKGHRAEGGRHDVHLRRLEIPETDDKTSLRRVVAESYSEALGQAVLEHADQYFWYHRRWRPGDED